MVNIFYTYYQDGPRKVVDNLIKGLEKNKIEYSRNQRLFDNSIFLSSNSDTVIHEPSNTIIGPNIWFEDSIVTNQNYKFFLVPSVWVRELILKNVSIEKEKVKIWQVGIDTDYFRDTKDDVKELDCFIYFKNREHHELQLIKHYLAARNLNYEIIYYGQYKEQEFLNVISKSRFAIILDNTESQGIAIQEIMSSNLPLFVWDKINWSNEKYSCEATSIPNWNSNCGIFFHNPTEFEYKFGLFLDTLDNFNPRKFVLQELSLEEQAKKLINLFNQ